MGVRLLAVLAASALFVAACSKSTDELIQQGRDFMAKGELSAAVIAFKNAVQAEPSSHQARVGLGDALERTGDLQGAEQNFRRAIDLGGKADELVPRIAIILLDRADIAILIREFGEKTLTDAAADSELRGIVALAHLAQGRKDPAKAQLARVKSQTPAVRLANAQLAVLSDGPQAGLTGLEGLLKEGKAPWWVLRAASRLYGAQGDRAMALEAMKSAYDSAAWHQGLIGEYAELLFEAGRPEEVKPLRDKLRRIAPRYYRTVFLDALFYMRDGKYDEAHDAAVKVLNALPNHGPSQLIAAKVEIDRGELASAAERVKKVLASSPSSLDALRMKMLIDVRRGDFKSAAAALERALRLAPNDRNLLAGSAELAWARGDKAGAAKQMAAAAQVQPPQTELLVKLAEMKYSGGKRDEAAKAIGQAAEIAGEDSRLRELVFRSLLRMRMLERAREMAKAELARRTQEPEPYMWMAAVLGSEGNEAGALEHTGRALDRRPDYYPALLALGGTANTPDRVKAYAQRLGKAVEAKTANVRIYLDLARQLRIGAADSGKVGDVLAKGVAADPASIAMRSAAIRHWLDWAQKDKALALAKEGEDALPDNVAMKELAAATQDMAGNPKQAMEKYGELFARFPERLDWGMKYGQLLARAGKTPDAIQALRKMALEHPDDPGPYQMLAMLQFEQKQTTEALLTADLLAGRPRHKALGLLLRGDIYALLKEKGEALKTYDQAGKAGAPEAAVLRRVQLHERTGGEIFAASELREWLSKHPDSVAALTVAVHRANARQDYPTAIRHLEKLAKLNPANPVVINDLAWAYTRTRNPAALATARKAAAMAPDNPNILDTLAEALVQAGKPNEAIASMRHAMAFAPGNPFVKIRLAELLLAAGNKQEAGSLLGGLDAAALDGDAKQRLEMLKKSL